MPKCNGHIAVTGLLRKVKVTDNQACYKKVCDVSSLHVAKSWDKSYSL